MLNNSQLNQIQDILFSDPEQYVYAVIDGAACPELRFKIYDWEPVSSCLWSGELEPDLEEVAPYMVLLERDSQFTEWLITEGWGRNWNIFAKSKLGANEVRKVLKSKQLVKVHDGRVLFFRFYDPRVMNHLFEVFTNQQYLEFIDKIDFIYFKTESSDKSSVEIVELKKGNTSPIQRFIAEC